MSVDYDINQERPFEAASAPPVDGNLHTANFWFEKSASLNELAAHGLEFDCSSDKKAFYRHSDPRVNMNKSRIEHQPHDIQPKNICIRAIRITQAHADLPGKPTLMIDFKDSKNIVGNQSVFSEGVSCGRKLFAWCGTHPMLNKTVFEQEISAPSNDLILKIQCDPSHLERSTFESPSSTKHLVLLADHPLVQLCTESPHFFHELGLNEEIVLRNGLEYEPRTIGDLREVSNVNEHVTFCMSKDGFKAACEKLKSYDTGVPTENIDSDLVIRVDVASPSGWSQVLTNGIYASDEKHLSPIGKEMHNVKGKIAVGLSIDYYIV
jgi:hypothetical protein